MKATGIVLFLSNDLYFDLTIAIKAKKYGKSFISNSGESSQKVQSLSLTTWRFMFSFLVWFLCVLINQIYTASCVQAFILPALHIYSLSLKLRTDIKEAPRMKPSARLLCPGLHPLCPHYNVWEAGLLVPATPHCKHPFFLWCGSVISLADSTLSSTGQTKQTAKLRVADLLFSEDPFRIRDMLWILLW